MNNKTFLIVLLISFILPDGVICPAQMNHQPSNLANDAARIVAPVSEMIPHYLVWIENYSPTIEQKLKEGLTGKLDQKDYNVTVDAIRSLQLEFQKWDTLPAETRLSLEYAHQFAWGLLSLIYKRTENREVKLAVFRCYNISFKHDGKHLASLLHEIPTHSPSVQEIIDERPPYSSDFLTAHLWALLRRTEDPAVVAGIASLVYRADSAAGYDELQAKQTQIQKSTLPSNQKELILYYIEGTFLYRQNDATVRNYNINRILQPSNSVDPLATIMPARTSPAPVLNSNLPKRAPYKGDAPPPDQLLD